MKNVFFVANSVFSKILTICNGSGFGVDSWLIQKLKSPISKFQIISNAKFGNDQELNFHFHTVSGNNVLGSLEGQCDNIGKLDSTENLVVANFN